MSIYEAYNSKNLCVNNDKNLASFRQFLKTTNEKQFLASDVVMGQLCVRPGLLNQYKQKKNQKGWS
jgi:uncharacterized membrane protein YjjB (DUF3815 family)